jgi:phosphoribosylpyrophosphate synthetase
VLLASSLAQAISTKLGCPAPIVWRKQPDASKVIVNPVGVQQYCNPGGKPRTDKQTPEVVYRRWRKQADEWVNGSRQMKQVEEYARRGNLFNLYVPPDGFNDSDFADRSHLIVDDITTFQTTITNIAWYLLDNQALSVTGAVGWRFD